MLSRRRIFVRLSFLFATLAFPCVLSAADSATRGNIALDVDRSPVDLAISSDGKWLVTANETSDSVSLLDVANARLVDEIRVGKHPAKVAFANDSKLIVVSNQYSGELSLLQIRNNKLEASGSVFIGHEPCGIAISPDGRRAYVGMTASAQVAEVDLREQVVRRHFDVGTWPRYLTLSPDGERLAVGSSGDSEIEVLDAETGERLYDEPLANGLNIGQMTSSKDGEYAYFTWMIYRTNPITIDNIQRGWILASRIGRVRLDGPSYREAISLDVPRLAVADPHGIAISPDGNRLVATSSGTHELLVYRLPDLPFVATGGPGDLIEPELRNDRDRFDRIELGGRPMGTQISSDSRTVYVANYLRNSVQFVDLKNRKLVDEVDLGGPAEPSLARRGMAIFYDATRSLDQWYSCHTCHQNGGINSRPMDTWNDGSEMTLKTVLPLYQLTKTGPWTWHGWQEDLDDAMEKSFTSTMKGRKPTAADSRAVLEYLSTLSPPPNSFASDDQPVSEAVQRGKAIFNSSRAACVDCHSGPQFTDGQIHDVGTGSKDDRYDGYNTPSLVGTHRKVRWLHSGRAKSLQRVLEDLHSPESFRKTKAFASRDRRSDRVFDDHLANDRRTSGWRPPNYVEHTTYRLLVLIVRFQRLHRQRQYQRQSAR
ncbi:MAG: beta-propeller fold lactonase family protein [Pirellulaceae bacterium]